MPPSIVDLVNLFEQNRDQYRGGAFSETAARLQFIDPFFDALGWDMYNKAGFAERYKEVVHEDKIKVGGATKAPDYSFRLGPARMFFVEAKKPAVDISHDVEPAYQLRRYAWSAGLPVSILTDFEEFSVLRLPQQAGQERQGHHRAHHVPEVYAVRREGGRDRRHLQQVRGSERRARQVRGGEGR